MKIGILGSGLMGGKLGTIMARLGHDVVFSYARSCDKLEQLARAAGPTARAGTPAEAAEGADVLLLAVNWGQLDDVLAQAGPLDGRLLITCSLPLSPDNTELVIAHHDSGAEALARRLPGTTIVQAFHTLPSEVLFDVAEGRVRQQHPSLLLHGEDTKAKSLVAALAQTMGFDPIDAGPLRIARLTEPFALFIGELAYRRLPSPSVWYRFGTT